MQNIKLIYVDLFCGGGGTTTGVHSARIDGRKCAIVAACVNHDEKAIQSHKSNHKQTLHFTEDITLLYSSSRMGKLVSHVQKMQAEHTEAKLVLWASLECTNFSKAKGGQPRDADSRTLAHHLFPYIHVLNPDMIQIENVEEFMSWGELDENGKPISKKAGVDYTKWVNDTCRNGYWFEHRIMNSADFGAYTSRKRFFGQFARIGEPITWPEPTHAEKPSETLFGKPLKKWKAVKDVLDFSDVGTSIFDRKKPMVDATHERVYAGLIKFVAGGKKEFLVKWNSMNKQKKYTAPSTENPCPTVTVQNRLGMCFISKAYSGAPASKNVSIENPCGAITTIDHHQFISAYYGTGDNVTSTDRPAPTVTTKDRLSMVFIDQQYGNGSPSSASKPCMTLTANPKQGIVSIEASKYLINPQFSNDGWSIDRPCFTLIAKMDKRPPYLVEVETSSRLPSFIHQDGDCLVYHIYEDDTDIVKKIKEFMSMFGITDIKMRMLRIPELKRIMGFPENYTLIGTQADQKKFIGNAVEVNIAKAIVEATAKSVKLKQLAA